MKKVRCLCVLWGLLCSACWDSALSAPGVLNARLERKIEVSGSIFFLTLYLTDAGQPYVCLGRTPKDASALSEFQFPLKESAAALGALPKFLELKRELGLYPRPFAYVNLGQVTGESFAFFHRDGRSAFCTSRDEFTIADVRGFLSLLEKEYPSALREFVASIRSAK